ncbi:MULTISPECIES: hypothetical protein [unclassified Variovorax]|uniref:hypothetical protein n=1 Tax=unclassified Variovorax TaxID=663243 RepID=UPI0008B7EECC|nr:MULTISPECIES: hypothetical protein [unclassified Variovorax]SEK17115.1 hypothetical protein SAMN05518853_1367 [Variovorax sp. OK202]SFE72658.1 hypothetical protein SAMN05444746_1357 [Variovorax sp. OK212]
MATSSILGGERAPIEPKGTDEESLGPSDSSDSGSDAAGTGEHASAEPQSDEATNADILPDRVGVLPHAAQEVSAAVDDPEEARAEDLAVERGEGEQGEEGEEGEEGDEDAGNA